MAHDFQLPIAFKFMRVPIHWELQATVGGGRLVGKRQGRPAQEIDGWESRREFLSLPEDDEALCKFANKVGLWDANPAYEGGPTQKYIVVPHEREISLPKTIYEWTARAWGLRKAILNDLESKRFIALYASPGSNRGSGLVPELPFRFKLNAKAAMGLVTTVSFWEMLLTTIYIDIARGFRFARCQRQDCNGERVFSVETEHKRKYCSQYCGHLESMRRQRRLTKKSRGGKTK
jgi:hypothetical protein